MFRSTVQGTQAVTGNMAGICSQTLIVDWSFYATHLVLADEITINFSRIFLNLNCGILYHALIYIFKSIYSDYKYTHSIGPSLKMSFILCLIVSF